MQKRKSYSNFYKILIIDHIEQFKKQRVPRLRSEEIIQSKHQLRRKF